VRFAFYGRTSTVDYQDRCSSRGWQREVAESVIAGRGWIVEEFFNVGCSRRLPWSRRPRAAALLAAAEAGECRFDAIVKGEYERAFATGDQFTDVAARLGKAGVQVWLPEAGGRVDVASPAHQALVTVLGAQSCRAPSRVLRGMSAASWGQMKKTSSVRGGSCALTTRLLLS
jgi:site-specific DNA recombinase